MNIPDGLRVPQHWQWLLGSNVTGGTIGAFLVWFFGIRKTNAEIKKLKAEAREINLRIETMQESQLVAQLSSTLINRSNCLDPNNNVLAKADWSRLLPVEHRNLIDAVLMKLMEDGLARETIAGSWMIGYGVKRFRG